MSATANEPQEPPDGSTIIVRMNKARVLVVDDEDLIR